MAHSLDELLGMSGAQLFDIMRAAHPIDREAVADSAYTGIDLSMPALFHRLFWRSFRKTFHKDPVTGVIRGWNVKVEQTGWESPPAPLRDRQGRPKTFGHYELRSAEGLSFPRGWKGSDYLDYRVAGNLFSDFPARVGFCPLVAVNEGSVDLLLGWEIFRLGDSFVPLQDFWLLRREGALSPEDVLPRPIDAVAALPS